MISDEEAEKANDWIRDNADTYAITKSQREQLEHYTKVIEGKLLPEAPGGSVADRMCWVHAHEDYISHIDAIQIAREEELKLAWLKDAAVAKIDIWRTQQASMRKGV